MAAPMRKIDWYFDFVSPYSCICLHRLQEISVPITYRPGRFGGLLNHGGQKGPAEIPAKRRWTYRWCTWWAKELGILFRFPAEHPFNPLRHLRLAIACGNAPDAVKRIFDSIWMNGGNGNDPARFLLLCKELGDDENRLADKGFKDSLIKKTGKAGAPAVLRVA